MSLGRPGGHGPGRPACEARATASERDAAPSLRYTAWAWVLTVLADTPSCSAISRNERWLGRKRRMRSSAMVSDEGPPRLVSARLSIYDQASSNHRAKITAPPVR